MRGREDGGAFAEGFTGRDRLALGSVGSGCREHAIDAVVGAIGEVFTRIGDDSSRGLVSANGEGDCCRLGNVEEVGWSTRGANKGRASEVVSLIDVGQPRSSGETRCYCGVIEYHRFPK